eukprot:3750902-Rhodomonas_salina.1
MSHIDVTQAFLCAELKEDKVVYVQPLRGFEEEDGKVWRLNKVLYGLVQAPVRYFEAFTSEVRSFGMKDVGFE